MPRLISKRVRVLDCNCSDFSTQGSADRFDFCQCEVRVEKGKHRAIERPGGGEQKYEISTVFIAAEPNRAYGPGLSLERKRVPLRGSTKVWSVPKLESS